MIKEYALKLHKQYNQSPILAKALAHIINPLSKTASIITLPLVLTKHPLNKQRQTVGFDTKQIASIKTKYELYLKLIPSTQDKNGFIQTDECDSTLFSGLIGAAGSYVCLLWARNSDGAWLRRPTYLEPCWYEGKGKGSTISRDMLLGVLWWAWAKKDLKTAEELFEYGRKNSWVMGKGDVSRIYFTPALQATLAEIIYKLGGKNHRIYRNLSQSWPTGLWGYQMHLQMLHLELRSQLLGGINFDMMIAITNNYSREPNNAFAQLLYAKYISGSLKKTSSLLLYSNLWPEKRLPSSLDRYSPWILSSRFYNEDGAENPDFSPDKEEPEKKHSGGDFLFVAKLLLDMIRQ